MQGSIFSGQSRHSRGTILEDRGVTFQVTFLRKLNYCSYVINTIFEDIKSIMPTVLILLFTLLIMVTVIPYAFSNVIKQLQAVNMLEAQQGMSNRKLCP